jgi:hypothetical protein
VGSTQTNRREDKALDTVFQVLRRKQEGVELETKFLEEKLEFKIC